MAIRLVAAAGVVLAMLGCGPVQSTTVIWDATTELEGARAAECERHAPYEYVSAEVYLEKALEEQAHADYEPAIVYGTRALKMAKAARAKTRQATAGPPKAPPVPGAIEVVPSPEVVDPGREESEGEGGDVSGDESAWDSEPEEPPLVVPAPSAES